MEKSFKTYQVQKLESKYDWASHFRDSSGVRHRIALGESAHLTDWRR